MPAVETYAAGARAIRAFSVCPEAKPPLEIYHRHGRPFMELLCAAGCTLVFNFRIRESIDSKSWKQETYRNSPQTQHMQSVDSSARQARYVVGAWPDNHRLGVLVASSGSVAARDLLARRIALLTQSPSAGATGSGGVFSQ